MDTVDMECAAEAARSICADAADLKQPTVKQIVASIVGKVTWLTEVQGLCECPGSSKHTAKNGPKDSILYLNEVPTLHCFHGSCKPEVDEANRRLRQALAEGATGAPKGELTDKQKEELQRAANHKRNVQKRATKARDRLLKLWEWPYNQIIQDSPVDLSGSAFDHWRLLLGCFEPGDVVWTGQIHDSGKPEHQGNFRPVEEWLKELAVPGQFVCPAAFKSNSCTRSNSNVLQRRFLVVESDVLIRDEVGAVFRWLRDKVGLNLRAIVDTAGKSLHAWFDYPDESTIEQLKLVLPGLGCDPKLFTASQPVRMPSAIRDGKNQKLVYLANEVAI